jgi:hypothetical protein
MTLQSHHHHHRLSISSLSLSLFASRFSLRAPHHPSFELISSRSHAANMGGGGPALPAPAVVGGYLTGKKLIYPLALVISLFFLWGFSYGACEKLPRNHRNASEV